MTNTEEKESDARQQECKVNAALAGHAVIETSRKDLSFAGSFS